MLVCNFSSFMLWLINDSCYILKCDSFLALWDCTGFDNCSFGDSNYNYSTIKLMKIIVLLDALVY